MFLAKLSNQSNFRMVRVVPMNKAAHEANNDHVALLGRGRQGGVLRHYRPEVLSGRFDPWPYDKGRTTSPTLPVSPLQSFCRSCSSQNSRNQRIDERRRPVRLSLVVLPPEMFRV